MYCIVPLAGPDFYNEQYGIKPLFEVEGEPLIKKAIWSRSWYRSGELLPENIIFVLRETPYTKKVTDFLAASFAGCRVVIIPEVTKGALMSTLAGVNLINDFEAPVVVDLVDFIYDHPIHSDQIFSKDRSIGGILPYFKSTNKKYSYLIIKNNFVKKTIEKKVISENASAGTYFFKNISVLLDAFKDSIKNENDYAVKGNLFICPAFNGIIKNKMLVYPVRLQEIEEISLRFH